MALALALLALAGCAVEDELAVTTQAASYGTIVGSIDGIRLVGDDYYVYGWACQSGVEASIRLHLYVDRSAYDSPRGTHVYSGETGYDGGWPMSVVCGTDSTLHRFHVALPDELLREHAGKKLYVHGLRVVGSYENRALLHSGEWRLPTALSEDPRGCMPTASTAVSDQSIYPSEYSQGQGDPWVYVAWVWRTDPDVISNHSVSVMRTQDMRNWFNTCGEPIRTRADLFDKTVVDPVVHGGGLLNNVKLGYDASGKPIISYQKYETRYHYDRPPTKATQIFNARFDGTRWTVGPVTNWTTLHSISGGGSLPRTTRTVGFGPVHPLSDGTLVQFLDRAEADETGVPVDGAWILHEPTQRLTPAAERSPADPDAMLAPPGRAPLPADALVATPRPSGYPQSWQPKRVWASYDQRWIEIRGDWDGDGHNDAGLFDRRRARFHLFDDDGGVNDFAYGNKNTLYWPLVGPWGDDGGMGVGVYNPLSDVYYVRHSLDAGYADATFAGELPDELYPVADSPMRWFPAVPSATTFIKYDTLPSNRDYSYNCDGTPREDYVDVPAWCRYRFNTDLSLYRYDVAAGTWSEEYIDRAWGGANVVFALHVFKNKTIIVYYDTERRIKVAIGQPGQPWDKRVLSSERSFGGWDGHNYLTVTVDEHHDIHLSGNMHTEPLVYWRSRGLNTSSLAPHSVAPGDEDETTYPRFFRGANGELLFSFRDGRSGDGVTLLHEYDPHDRTWTQLSHPFD